MVPRAAGNVFLQPERFAAKPAEILDLVEEFRIEALGGSSSVAARIMSAPDLWNKHRDLGCLKHLGFGQELIVPKIITKFARCLRRMRAYDLEISLGYGMTEAGLICKTPRLPADEMAARLKRGPRPVSVGACTSGYSLRIVDDKGSPLPSGFAGNVEIWSAEKLFSGYLNDPNLTCESFTQDGWFKTGDVGIADQDELRIIGRKKAIIVVNSRNASLEWIEAPLLGLDGICRSLIAAAPIRSEKRATDELAIFFVPRPDQNLDDLCRKILRIVARDSGIPVKHLVPVQELDFPLTSTGKIQRSELVSLYHSGRLRPHQLTRVSTQAELSERQAWLVELWKIALKLDEAPRLEDNFFDLGGDSLASAELISAVEEQYHCHFLVEDFFEHPTISTMEILIAKQAALPVVPEAPQPSRGRLLEKLRKYTASWQGHRLFRESLIVAFNVSGKGTPFVWVQQEYTEASQLAKHLGPQHPLYAMRSCVDILPVREYTARNLEVVCNRYLWELLALPLGSEFVLGGTCQGGILALELARRLKQIKRKPLFLALLEWSYSKGRYNAPTLFVYGEQSYTADIYANPQKIGPDWRGDFPRHKTASVPGTHGELETDDVSVAALAAILKTHCLSSKKRRSAWSRIRRQGRQALRLIG